MRPGPRLPSKPLGSPAVLVTSTRVCVVPRVNRSPLACPGPDHWHELYPIAKGDNQSPIELHTKDIKYDSSLQPWSASYDPGSCKSILNNGKTCRVVFDDTYDRSSE